MRNILIADAGSSKTSWTYIPDKPQDFLRVKSSGINPAHDNPEELSIKLIEIATHFKGLPIHKIFFFGAGCATPDLKNILMESLSEAFQVPEVFVDSDLMAAALSLFGDGDGIACILGTGSNTGLYVGGKLIDRIPPLGFILGDEGSGVALGKDLLNAIFKRRLPDDIIKDFQNTYHISLDELIQKVYRSPKPAPFIAGFAPFLLQHKHLPQIRDIIDEEFDAFFKKNLTAYNFENFNIGFVGSVAFNFKDILEEKARDFNISISKILKEPIQGLEDYFLKK